MTSVVSIVCLWIVCNTGIKNYLETWLGGSDVYGVPRFRLGSGFWTQLFCLPASFYLSIVEYGSFGNWIENTGCPWDDLWPSVFSCVFAAFMIYDFVALRPRPAMVVHHIVCLFSIFICSVGYPEGFPYYALGVVTMELGSATFNITLLGASHFVYLVGMTLSNILSVVVFYFWMSSLTSWIGVLLVSVLYIPIVFVRQLSVHLRMSLANAAPS